MQQKKTTKEEYQKCVNVVVEYINQHLGEEIDLKSLAKVSNFSPFYFHRIMKAFLGEPIGTFIVRTRTEAAARLLRYSDIPIADIAYRIGYASPSSLSGKRLISCKEKASDTCFTGLFTFGRMDA